MVLGLTIEANGWVVALAAVLVLGLRLLFWHRTGRVVVDRLGSIEMKADDAAIGASAAREAAVVSSIKTDNIQASIGMSNGQGPVVDMIEKLMESLGAVHESNAGLHHRVSELEAWARKRHDENRSMVALLGAKVSEIGTRLDETLR